MIFDHCTEYAFPCLNQVIVLEALLLQDVDPRAIAACVCTVVTLRSLSAAIANDPAFADVVYATVKVGQLEIILKRQLARLGSTNREGHLIDVVLEFHSLALALEELEHELGAGRHLFVVFCLLKLWRLNENGLHFLFHLGKAVNKKPNCY